MKPTSPCLGCTKRNEYCHIQGNCRDYDDFKIAYNNYINQIKVSRDVDNMYRGCKFYCMMKICNHMKNHLK